MFRVTMQFSGKPVKKFTFDKTMVAIGRDATCDIVIDNIGASRRHATIERTTEGYVLTDLKSHNGTFVNGEKVFHHQLRDSDEFFIGKYCFVFESLEPIVEVTGPGSGADAMMPDAPAAAHTPASMPDMTFRLDRKEIERIIGNSARGSSPQLVQIAPETEKRTLSLDKAYYLVGTGPSCEIRVKGAFLPKIAGVVIRGDHGFRVVGLARSFRVNGKRVVDGPLADGDLVQVGGRRFRFCQA